MKYFAEVKFGEWGIKKYSADINFGECGINKIFREHETSANEELRNILRI